jgi:hypothetical protein
LELFGVMIGGSTHDLNGIEFVSRDVGMESKNGTGSGDWTGRIMKWWNLARADDATSTVVPRAGGVSSTPCSFGSLTAVSGILDHPRTRVMTGESVAHAFFKPDFALQTCLRILAARRPSFA